MFYKCWSELLKVSLSGRDSHGMWHDRLTYNKDTMFKTFKSATCGYAKTHAGLWVFAEKSDYNRLLRLLTYCIASARARQYHHRSLTEGNPSERIQE
jgi:hypothetical protein